MSRPGEYLDPPNAEDAARAVQPAADEPSDDAEVSEIRENIRQTRADMTETIDELQERLSPSYVKEQVKQQVREQYTQIRDTIRDATIGKVEDMVDRISDTAYVTRRSIVETVSANPVPSALVGIGLAWLWMNRRSDSGRSRYGRGDGYRDPRSSSDYSGHYGWENASSRYQGSDRDWQRDTGYSRGVADKAGGALSTAAGKVQETASNLADRTKETASNLADKTKETVSGLIDQANQKYESVAQSAQYQARRVEETFNSSLRENPLAVGAVALAIGTAVGLAIPQTRKENEWMGEARDTLVDKAQSVASEAIDKVQQVAEKVANEASSTSSQGTQGYRAHGQGSQGQGSQDSSSYGSQGTGSAQGTSSSQGSGTQKYSGA